MSFQDPVLGSVSEANGWPARSPGSIKVKEKALSELHVCEEELPSFSGV